MKTVDVAVKLASNMSFKGKNPTVHLVEKLDNKGVVVGKKELKKFQPFWKRSEKLPKWNVTILPLL